MHERLVCKRRPVECPDGCGAVGLHAAALELHGAELCPHRLCECPHGCGARLTWKALREHVHAERGDCPERPQRCRLDALTRRINLRMRSLVARTDPDSGALVSKAIKSGGGTHLLGLDSADPASDPWERAVIREYDEETDAFKLFFSNTKRGHAWVRLADLEYVTGAATTTTTTTTSTTTTSCCRGGAAAATAAATRPRYLLARLLQTPPTTYPFLLPLGTSSSRRRRTSAGGSRPVRWPPTCTAGASCGS